MLSKIFFTWWLWIYIFSTIHLTKGKLALMVWWVELQTFCFEFESFQRHKKEAFLRVYCSREKGEKSPKYRWFFSFRPFFFPLNWRFIAWCRYINDISVIFFCRFSTIFLLFDFSSQNIMSTSPDTRYIVNISQYFPPWL